MFRFVEVLGPFMAASIIIVSTQELLQGYWRIMAYATVLFLCIVAPIIERRRQHKNYMKWVAEHENDD